VVEDSEVVLAGALLLEVRPGIANGVRALEYGLAPFVGPVTRLSDFICMKSLKRSPPAAGIVLRTAGHVNEP
jgi:hypothetical protein